MKTFAVAADASTTRAGKREAWTKLLRTVSGTHALALADQGVVSGASFVTAVLISRWTSPTQLGFYSIGISLLVSLVTVQDSLVVRPYAIQRYRPQGMPAEHAGASLTHSSLLSALAIVALAAAALGLWARDTGPELVVMTWALAAVAPFALLREFGRGFAYAHLHIAQALILDVAVAAIQLGALHWVGWTGRMSSATAFLALGAACAPTATVWLYLARGNFAIRADQLWATMMQSWGLGKWLFVGQIAVLAQGYVAHWLLAWVAGARATGVYAACLSIISFANPLILGLGNILTPRAALALNEGGRQRLWRQSVQDSLLFGIVMTLFCTAVVFAGDDVMRLLYPGKDYEGHGHTLTVLAVALLASAIGTPASNALAVMERPRAIFWASLVGAVLTAVLVWRLTIEWGLVGAAYGFLAGNVAGAVGRWAAFSALVPRYGPKPDSEADLG